jgi:hypothetical protein
MRVNISDTIKVKLTSIGIEVLKEEEKRLRGLGCNTNIFVSYPEDKEGYTSFTIWEFSKLFGKYFSMGMNVKNSPIELNFIIEDN